MEQFITTSQLARLAELSADGVRYKIRTGELRADARTERGTALFNRANGERWAAAHKGAKVAQPGAAA